MEDRETKLIKRLKAQIASGETSSFAFNPYRHKPSVNPPVSQEELAKAESMLGFELPFLLKRIYLEVGDGGFGLAYGLFKLSDERNKHRLETIVQSYLGMRSMTQEDIDAEWENEDEKPILWPEKLLMICDWGCNIYSHVDCASPECRVLRSDSNISLSQFALESPSLYQWLEDWLNQTFHFDWDTAEKITFSSEH
jgi:hypothetical protein